MTHITFTDPNIRSTGTFDVGEHMITAPIIQASEAADIVRSTGRSADAYFSAGKRPLSALQRSFALWSDPGYPLRREALPTLAALTHFSEANIACYGLAPLGEIRLDPERLINLPGELAQLISSGLYRSFVRWGNGYLRGFGTPHVTYHRMPNRLLQVLAGNVVGPTWLSVSLGAAIQGPQIIKLPSRDLASLMFYLRTLDEVDPAFRKTIACGYYPPSDGASAYLLAQSDLVVAMGSDQSVHAIRRRLSELNRRARVISHGFRISFQAIGKAYATPQVAALAAWGIVAYDGNGCFSPANVYVEQGGLLSPRQFAETLAAEMETLAGVIPPKRTLATAERITGYRNRQMQRRLLGEKVTVLKSANTDYTVVLDEEDPRLAPTCQERAVMVKPVKDIRDVSRYVEHLSQNLQTVGLAVPSNKLLDIADELATVGVTSVKPVGLEYTLNMLEPHDGIFDTVQVYMSDALRWTSVSFTDTDQAIAEAQQVKARALENGRAASAEPPGQVESISPPGSELVLAGRGAGR